MLLSAGAARLARSPVSPSTGSICPLRGRHKEANSKTGKQLQLGRLKVLQARLRLPLLGRNSRRETDQTITRIQALRGRASLGRCSHVPTPSVTPGLRSTPGTVQFQASLSPGYGRSLTPPCASSSLGALARTLEPIAGRLWAPGAVEEGTRGGVLTLAPSSAPLPPTHPLPARGSFRNRPAAANSLAGGGCKRSAVERFN